MKTSILLALALSACAAEEVGVTTAALGGDDWVDADDNDYNGHGAGTFGIATAAGGRVIAVGARSENGAVETWIVRSKAAPGGTFALGDAYRISANHTSRATDVAVDNNANKVYVTGYAEDAAGIQHLITRSATVGVSNWVTVDDYAAPSGQYIEPKGVAVASNGEVFAVATIGGVTVVRHEGTNGVWGPMAAPANSFVGGICANGTGVVAVGEPLGTSAWTVWSWTGSAWSAIDSFAPSAYVEATACVANGSTLYVGGAMMLDPSSGAGQWLVRSRTGSGSWASVDSTPTSQTRGPDAMAVGRSGRIYMAGSIAVGTNRHWRVRRSGGQLGWVDSDDVQTTGQLAEAHGIAFDLVHDALYAAGVEDELSGTQHLAHGVVRQSD